MTGLFEMFQIPFMRTALAASAVIGIMCGYLGVFVVLRRIVFVGIAMAQLSALGVATAIYLDKDPTVFALAFTIVGVAIFAPDYGGRKLPPEALIGVGFTAAWAFAILILSKAAHGEADMLNLVRGNVLGATEEDVMHLLIVAIAATAVFSLFYRQILFSSFDPEMARTLGIKAGFWNFVFYLVMSVIVAAAIKVSGVLLTFSFLLFPAATALLIGKSLRANFIIAVLSSLISAFIGLIVSFQFDLPTGPAMVAASFILFALILLTSGITGLLTNSNFSARETADGQA